LSSIEAFARTLTVHRRNAAKSIALAVSKSSEPLLASSLFEPDSDEDVPDAEAAEMEDAEVGRATRAGASIEDDATAKNLLFEMSTIAEAARDRPDAKIVALLDWIRANQCPDLPGPGEKPKPRLTWKRPKRVQVG